MDGLISGICFCSWSQTKHLHKEEHNDAVLKMMHIYPVGNL